MLSEKVNAQPDDALSSVSAAWFFSGAIMVLFALSFYILGVTSIVSKLILKSWLPSPLFLNISLVLGIWTAVQIMRRTILKRFPAGRYKMTRNEIMSVVAAVVLMISISLVIAKFTGEKLFSAVYGVNNSDPLQLFLIAVSLSLYVSVVCIMLKSYKSLYATIFSIIICVYLFYSYATIKLGLLKPCAVSPFTLPSVEYTRSFFNLFCNQSNFFLILVLYRVVCPRPKIHKQIFMFTISKLSTVILSTLLVLVKDPECNTNIRRNEKFAR